MGKANAVHHMMWAREDSRHLDPAQQKQAEEKAKREAKKAKADAWLKAQNLGSFAEDGETEAPECKEQEPVQKAHEDAVPYAKAKASAILQVRSTRHMFQDASQIPVKDDSDEEDQLTS